MLAPAVVQEAVTIAQNLLGETPVNDAVRVVREHTGALDAPTAAQMIARIHCAQVRYFGRLMEEPSHGELGILGPR